MLGYSLDSPVTIGGGLIFVAFNEHRYLERLRGPAGEPLTYERKGSHAVGEHMVDAYQVSHAGLAKPVLLYLDTYAPGPNGVPDGFTVDRPEEPFELARSLVPALPRPRQAAAVRRRWRLAHQEGRTMGFVEWDGAVSIDMPERAAVQLGERIERFLSDVPAGYHADVLADYLEVFVPWESSGVARGVAEPV